MTADLSVTLTYQQRGTRPPLFVAGTFSEPPWVPQEMDCSADTSGEMIFSKTCVLEPGEDVQYKFRVGTGDWWVLDESSPTISDPMGNVNNVIRAPAEEQLEPVRTKDEANGGPKDDANGGPPEMSVLPTLGGENGGIECDSTTNLLGGPGKRDLNYGATTEIPRHDLPGADPEEASRQPELTRPNGPRSTSAAGDATPTKTGKRGWVSRIFRRVWAGIAAFFRMLLGKSAA